MLPDVVCFDILRWHSNRVVLGLFSKCSPAVDWCGSTHSQYILPMAIVVATWQLLLWTGCTRQL